jgi:hypothetical protein
MYAEFMYKQGLYDIQELSENNRAKLRSEFFSCWKKTEGIQYENYYTYIKFRNERWEQERVAFEERLASEEALHELHEIYKQGYKSMLVDLVFATSGATISTIALLAPEPTGSTKAGAYVGYAWALEKYIGAARKYYTLTNGIFIKNKEYKIVGGLVKEYLGEGGYLVYNLADIATSGHGSITKFKSLTGTISGEKLNIFIQACFDGSDAAYTSYDYINNQLIKN